jgi:S-disulfanyl-L-cysteine oxidoreductase SoxD
MTIGHNSRRRGRRACLPRDKVRVLALLLTLATLPPMLAAQAPRSIHDGVYTEEQATRGEMSYAKQCSFCHGDDLLGGGFAPPLIGEPFDQRWSAETLGDLFSAIKATMPADKPASLPDQQYADIVAYLLRRNNVPVGKTELSAKVADLKGITFKKP